MRKRYNNAKLKFYIGDVGDVCGDFAYYFDPEDASSAADMIANYIKNLAGRDEVQLAAARAHVLNFSNPRERAERYMQIIQDSSNTP